MSDFLRLDSNPVGLGGFLFFLPTTPVLRAPQLLQDTPSLDFWAAQPWNEQSRVELHRFLQANHSGEDRDRMKTL